MVFFNYAAMELAAKIVYYGPGLCGKTTNLQYIYTKTSPKTRGEMISLATETDRTLFFDLLPIRLGTVGGFKTRFQLYTVPGQVFYNSTRKLVLKGVDSLVFVADSQEPMLDANIESLENLQENLAEHGLSLEELPWVIQYNKRDLPNVMAVAALNEKLNFMDVPYYEAIATAGDGVLETLKGISKLTLKHLRRKTGKGDAADEPTPPPRVLKPSDMMREAVERIRPTETYAETYAPRVEAPKDEAPEFDIQEERPAAKTAPSEPPATPPKREERPSVPAIAVGVGSVQVSRGDDKRGGDLDAHAARPRVTVSTAEADDGAESDAAADDAGARPHRIRKDVMEKIQIPVVIRKDESLSDVEIHLKLQIECVLTQQPSQPGSDAMLANRARRQRVTTSARALAEKTLEDFLKK
ncbi:MAG: hypothetical protein HYV63_27410 [Candidatus Schekmanbacteria bacterium]|nr:hypothetical protein [Candidatus Schekmanbacteria bacterium]